MAEQPGHRRGPKFLGHPTLGYGTACLATIGILAALRARHLTGDGQQVDVSLLDGVVAQSSMNWWWNEGDVSYLARSGTEKGFGRTRVVTDPFLCADGEWIMIHTGGPGALQADDGHPRCRRAGPHDPRGGDGRPPRRRRVRGGPPPGAGGVQVPAPGRMAQAVPRRRCRRPARPAPRRGAARRAGRPRRCGRSSSTTRSTARSARRGRSSASSAARRPRRSRRRRSGSTTVGWPRPPVTAGTATAAGPPSTAPDGSASDGAPPLAHALVGVRILDFSVLLRHRLRRQAPGRPRRRRDQGRDAGRRPAPGDARPLRGLPAGQAHDHRRPPGAGRRRR